MQPQGKINDVKKIHARSRDVLQLTLSGVEAMEEERLVADARNLFEVKAKTYTRNSSSPVE